jgi:hypothetical protein
MAHLQETDGKVELVWADGHVSPYPLTWLLNRSFRPVVYSHLPVIKGSVARDFRRLFFSKIKSTGDLQIVI